MNNDHYIVRDLLQPALNLVLCGTAPSRASAIAQAYYAHPGNRFWPTLHRIGITPERMHSQDYPDLLNLSIGLTDICKTAYGVDAALPKDAPDAEALHAKIMHYQPKLVAFTSKHTAALYFGVSGATLSFGLQQQRAGNTQFFICPSTSGANAHWGRQCHVWDELAAYLKKLV